MKLSTSQNSVKIEFAEQILSSSVGNMLLQFRSFAESFETQKSNSIRHLDFIFQETEMIDSVGLNLIKVIIEWAKKQHLTMTAEIHKEFVHMILASVWLDRDMEIITKY